MGLRSVFRPTLAVELDEYEIGAEACDRALEKLLQRGDITEPKDNHYRPT